MSYLRVFALTVALFVVAACGGSGGDEDDGPMINNFSAEQSEVQAGDTTKLLVDFSGDRGSIDQGVGLVNSGASIPVTVDDDTTYTLTVTDAGASVSAQVTISVVYDAQWTFDTADGWVLNADDPTGEASSARVEDGKLEVRASQFVEFTGACRSANASLTFGDEKMRAGRYERLSFEFAVAAAGGSGIGAPTISLTYAGSRIGFDLPYTSSPIDVRVDWGPTIALFVGGAKTADLTPVPDESSPAISVVTNACAADLEDESVVLDGVVVSGR